MNKKINKVGGLVLMVVCIIWAIYSIVTKNRLRKMPQVYTVGKIVSGRKSFTGGQRIDYTYEINGVKFRNIIEGSDYRVGDRYLVSVPKVKDENYDDKGYMQLKCKLSKDHIPPPEGWSTPPIKCEFTNY